jgi:hypothetical protein
MATEQISRIATTIMCASSETRNRHHLVNILGIPLLVRLIDHVGSTRHSSLREPARAINAAGMVRGRMLRACTVAGAEVSWHDGRELMTVRHLLDIGVPKQPVANRSPIYRATYEKESQ